MIVLMKNILPIAFSILIIFVSCSDNKLRINEQMETFSAFPHIDTLRFTPMEGEILDEPEEIMIHNDHLIINTLCRAKDKFLWIYSLKNESVINRLIDYGDGPNEMKACEMMLQDTTLCLYDRTKKKVWYLSANDCLDTTPSFIKKDLNVSYYDMELMDDSVVIGTNDMSSKFKLHFVNLKTGAIKNRGEYASFDKELPMSAMIDASSCYVDINPKTKDIVLSYRYTDVIEIYDANGTLKKALQGPDNYDVDFVINSNQTMGKTPQTRKAYVNSFATENYIYLLYSGCYRKDKNWSNGMRLFVFSWDGEPVREYVLEEPVYAFGIDEKQNKMYSFSLITENLIVTNLK